MKRALLPRIAGLVFIASNVMACGRSDGNKICIYGESQVYHPVAGQELPSGLPETAGVVFVRVDEGKFLTGRDRQGPLNRLEFGDRNHPSTFTLRTPSGVEQFKAFQQFPGAVEVDYSCMSTRKEAHN
ncbi:hypothetical protein HY029_05055 [Candidatus Gottesmanbacteria bacterium]|nr:hypothetical protein [Candidatus Gottesmanbacteria bacterium]